MNESLFFRRLLIGTTWTWVLLLALVPYIILLGASWLQPGTDTLVLPTLTKENYSHLLSSTAFTITAESVLLAACTAVLCLAIGHPFAAILANAPAKRQPLLLLLVMIPFWTNSLIRTYALVMLLKADGLINAALIRTGLITEPLQLMYTPFAVFIGLVYTLLPFMILPLYAALKAVDPKLLEAGRDLGASWLQNFLKITIPLTMPGIIAGTMLVFLPALGMFYVSDILGGARTMLLGNYIRDQFLVFRNIPMGSAASITMTLAMGLLLLLYYLATRRSGEKVMQ